MTATSIHWPFPPRRKPVLISPLDIEKSVESQKEEQAKAAQKAADKGQDYTPPVLRDQSYIARGLSRILGLEQGAIEERMEKTNSQYEILKKKTDQTISDEVRRFINGEIDPEGNEVPEKQRVSSGASGSSRIPSGTISTAHWPPA